MMKNKFVYMLLLVGILNAEYGEVLVKPSELRIENRGIVSDYHNYRMWQDNVVGNKKSWEDAVDYCQDLTLSGYDDWRLPNFNELYSITDNRRYKPSIKDSFAHTANQNQSY